MGLPANYSLQVHGFQVIARTEERGHKWESQRVLNTDLHGAMAGLPAAVFVGVTSLLLSSVLRGLFCLWKKIVLGVC